MYDNISVQYLGFEPESQAKSFIKQIAEKLEYQSPNGSAIQIVVKQSENFFQASCRIASLAGVFYSFALGSGLQNAVEQVEKKILKQLDDWRRNRFSESLEVN